MEAKCSALTATGYLFSKPGQTQVVIVSHGAGGIDARVFDRVDALQKEGMAALVIDHFGSRGISETINDLQSANAKGGNDFNLAVDTYTAIDWLERERGFAKFGAIGASLGGGAQIMIQQDWVRRAIPGLIKTHYKRDFKIHLLDASVALYAFCGYRNVVRDKFVDKPLLFISGEIDDTTPAKFCERQAPWMNERGGNAKFVMLPGQGHGFDDRAFYKFNPYPIHAANCDLMVDAQGVVNLKNNERTPGDGVAAMPQALKRCSTARGFSFGRRGDRQVAEPIWIPFFKQNL